MVFRAGLTVVSRKKWEVKNESFQHVNCVLIPEIAACQDWEMEEYPERMRQWLYLVMEELVTTGNTKQ